MRGALVGVGLAALGACKQRGTDPDARPSAQTTAAAPAAAPSQRDLDEIVAFVQSSQREGIAGRDPDAYMRVWASDARVVTGRRETPDAYDVAIDYPVLRPSAVLHSRGKADEEQIFRYDEVHAEAVGQEVRLRWKLTVNWVDGTEKGFWEAREIYRLRRRPEGWRVVESRTWPIATSVGDVTRRYDDAYWAMREEALESARKSRDPLDVVVALQRARHLREAYAAVRALTDANPKDARAWNLRATLADLLYLDDETVAAYRSLRDLDPSASVPGWVRAQPGFSTAPARGSSDAPAH